ncbi:DUF2325 domain-containing protein [Peptacetobacter hominis]|uniref:DUF2325 domain-containing protein n=1 Tax=Peptacetobacter hominis TaxID=2743610 RepID=A0A544QVL3_9FIRM|nr:DUF2325 domain-containing protein [Peptacetobacter hominis]TQQ84716.1 DUF2325 domain-containing protein [Peptacetobacter hominis]
MSLLVVGGHERMEKDYLEIGKISGFKTKVCTKKANKLAVSIGNPDAIIILTSTVSHKICSIVESKAKKKNIPIYRRKSSSRSSFFECIEQIQDELCHS